MICWYMRRAKDQRIAAAAATASRLHWQVAWDGKAGTPGEEVVFLTNRPVTDALRIFDRYDDRSLTCLPAGRSKCR